MLHDKYLQEIFKDIATSDCRRKLHCSCTASNKKQKESVFTVQCQLLTWTIILCLYLPLWRSTQAEKQGAHLNNGSGKWAGKLTWNWVHQALEFNTTYRGLRSVFTFSQTQWEGFWETEASKLFLSEFVFLKFFSKWTVKYCLVVFSNILVLFS